MEDFPGWSTSFKLMMRQDRSRHASGRTRTKNFGTPIWSGVWRSKSLTPNEMDQWRARIQALLETGGTFRASPSARCWPIGHPHGDGASNGTISSITVNRTRVGIAWSGDATLLQVGDFVEINGQWLHQVKAKISANVIEVVPALSVGASTTQAVNINKPGVLMTIDPDSLIEDTGLNGRGEIVFSAVEARG